MNMGLDKVPNFFATTENIIVINIVLVLNPDFCDTERKIIPAEIRTVSLGQSLNTY